MDNDRRRFAGTFRADARTRTGDPFITRERHVGDGRPRKATHGHVLAGNQAVSRPSEWTRVPARARADVPVLYPRCLVGYPKAHTSGLLRGSRMFDKARVARAGTLGPTTATHAQSRVPPLDKLGLDADTFADVAESAQSNHDVLARERAVGARPLIFVQTGGRATHRARRPRLPFRREAAVSRCAPARRPKRERRQLTPSLSDPRRRQ
jgi:hypothetical protein